MISERAKQLAIGWLSARDEGSDVSLEEYCREHPEVLAEVQEYVSQVDRGIQAVRGRVSISHDRVSINHDREIAGYRLIHLLGAGGFGQVWLANGTYGPVAAKIIQGVAADVELESLNLMKDIRHENLVRVLDTYRADEILMIVMELADMTLGQRRQHVVDEGESIGIPVDELQDYMRQVSDAIDFLNLECNVLHRDIKPSNILLVGDIAKVGDFGLAKALKSSVISHSHRGLSSPYAAPEVFRNESCISTDQYALAVTYCELQGGMLPFRAEAFEGMRTSQLNDPPDLSMLRDDEKYAVGRALDKDPKRRWPSCTDFVHALIVASHPGGSLWEVLEVRRFDCCDGPCVSVAASPSGRFAVASTHARTWLLDVEVGVVIRCAKGNMAKFSEDGKTIITHTHSNPGSQGDPQDLVDYWDVATGSYICTRECPKPLPVFEHNKAEMECLRRILRQMPMTSDRLLCITGVRDGRHVVTGGQDGVVRLWRLPSGNRYFVYQRPR